MGDEIVDNRQPSNWTDIMVDLETNDNNIFNASIIQLSAVMFNLETGEVGPVFNRCLAPITNWNPETFSWWTRDPDRQKTLTSILSKAEDPRTVINDFVRWNRTEGCVKHFWSKPSHFDYTLLSKYFLMYGYKNPFTYWKARDMRSYILGIVFPNPIPDLSVKDEKNAHDALTDTISQVEYLLDIHGNRHISQKTSDEDLVYNSEWLSKKWLDETNINTEEILGDDDIPF